MLIPDVQQNDSVTHVYIYIYVYIYMYIYVYTYIFFFMFFPSMVYQRMLYIVPCAIQKDLVVYPS